MRKIAAAAMIVTIALVAGCGSDTHESLLNEGVSLMKEASGILDGVKDEASGDAAAAKIEALVPRAQDLEKRGKALKNPSEDQAKALASKLGDAIGAMTELTGKAAKATTASKSKKLAEAITKFMAAMN